jgi:transposase InsO family protein
LDEFCATSEYSRKYAIALLRRPTDEKPCAVRRRRGPTYSAAAVRVLEKIWEAAGYPWSVRLKALLPQWLPWSRLHMTGVTPEIEAELFKMSPRQMDRRLKGSKRDRKRRIYGHSKPGTLLKQQIPIRTDHSDIVGPGFLEVDLVEHCGPCASGEFVYSLNVTDVHTGWTQTRAVLGKGETGVCAALEEFRTELPFALLGIDSDNGSEFINHHLLRWTRRHGVKFTRSRAYKKNDNAHIEQKNWTHVRKIFGWDRYDTAEQCAAMNAVYRGDLLQMMNLFQPCVKLVEKVRVGNRVRRKYDVPKTPLDRLAAHYLPDTAPLAVQKLLAARENMDPFALSSRIDKALSRLLRSTKTAEGKDLGVSI